MSLESCPRDPGEPERQLLLALRPKKIPRRRSNESAGLRLKEIGRNQNWLRQAFEPVASSDKIPYHFPARAK